MSDELTITQAYEAAKAGRWDEVLASWARSPGLALECSRFQKASSGWTFLHQAAYFGHEAACRALIFLGAATDAGSVAGETAADVADKRAHAALAALLRRAAKGAGSVWSAPKSPDLLPSSSLWAEAVERRATRAMRVAYASAVIKIPEGGRYFVDSFERTLIGWHGSYDPPCGMDGEPIVGG